MNLARKTLPFLLATSLIIGCENTHKPHFQGYIEGEYLYLSAPQAGYLQTLTATRGSRVSAGDNLFVIAGEPDSQSLTEAEAKAESARQKLENLKLPKRASEIAALEANLRAAQAAAKLTKLELERQQKLSVRQFTAQSALDQARSRFDQAMAEVEAVKKQIATFQNSLGRQAEIAGAESDLAATLAQIEQKRWLLEHKSVVAPVAGEISETYYQAGEWIAAGAPVASLLPDRKRRLRFYVSEPQLANLQVGTLIVAHCDGCPEPIHGKVDFIAAQAEYTPPVIYSRGSREKLVFRVEATPIDAQSAAQIRPGLAIDVELAPP